MLLVTQNKASEMPYAPSRQYLCKLSKEKNRPEFFVDDGKKILVNIEHPSWAALLERRRKEDPGRIVKTPKVKTKRETSKPAGTAKAKGKSTQSTKGGVKSQDRVITGKKSKLSGAVSIPAFGAANEMNGGNGTGLSSKELNELIRKSTIAQLEEQVIKNEYNRAKAEQEKMKMKIAAGELIEFRLAEFLFFGYLEKLNIELLSLTKKIEPIIHNLVQEKDTKGVLKRFDREFENILTEVRKAQAEDVKTWNEEAEKGKRKK